jgi:hypothetical protein
VQKWVFALPQPTCAPVEIWAQPPDKDCNADEIRKEQEDVIFVQMD